MGSFRLLPLDDSSPLCNVSVLADRIRVTDAISILESAHPDIFDLMEVTNGHPRRPSTTSPSFAEDVPFWRGAAPHIGEHCIAVVLGALALTKSLEIKLSKEELTRLIRMALLHDVLKLFELSYSHIHEREGLYEDEERGMEDMIRRELSYVSSRLLEEALLSGRACSPTGVVALLQAEDGVITLKKGCIVEKLLLASDSGIQTVIQSEYKEWCHRMVTPKARVEEIFRRSPDHEACMAVSEEGRIFRSESRDTPFFIATTFDFNVWFARYLLYDLSGTLREVEPVILHHWFSNIPRILDDVG